MVTVSVSVQIDQAAADVFAYIADMENNPSWQTGMRSCTWTSEPPLRLGSTYDQVASFMGKKIVSSFEVTEFVEGRTIRIQTTSGNMPLDVTRTVTGGGDSCEVSAFVSGQPPKVMRFLIGPVLSVMVDRSIRADYKRLKKQLES